MSNVTKSLSTKVERIAEGLFCNEYNTATSAGFENSDPELRLVRNVKPSRDHARVEKIVCEHRNEAF